MDGSEEVVRPEDAGSDLVMPTDQPELAPASEDDEAVAFALAFVGKLVRLRGIRIDREHFLTSELRRERVADEIVKRAVADRPASAGVSTEVLDAIARRSIAFETNKSTGIAFAAGLPGGFALLGTVPADVAQYYVHAFRVMQKLAYLYGWQSFIDDVSDVDDETLGKLGAFLGVMMGVSGASTTVSQFANNVARPAMQRRLANRALMQTSYYPLIKQTLRRVGVNINRQIFARTVTKVVPVVGGVVSGGLTYASLTSGSKRLARHLKTLPPALPDPVTED